MSDKAKQGLYGSELGGSMLRSGVAEAVGTFLLVFAGAATATAATLNRSIAGGAADSLAVALAFGLALVALVSALGHVSGAHLNPAVTLGLAATGKFPLRFVPAYLIAQLVGAIAAALAVWAIFGHAGRDLAALGATAPAQHVTLLQAFLAEMLITFFLVFIVMSVATDSRSPAAAGPAVGFALAAAILIGGPVTGGAVNPARALGPMIVAGTFTAAWVYILAPILGGVAAALLYDRFVKQTEKPEE
ncbi:MAG TPA: MIP family channel protein [Tepidisphaeraceae bacterium]|jgi:MIP family channel proteins